MGYGFVVPVSPVRVAIRQAETLSKLFCKPGIDFPNGSKGLQHVSLARVCFDLVNVKAVCPPPPQFRFSGS